MILLKSTIFDEHKKSYNMKSVDNENDYIISEIKRTIDEVNQGNSKIMKPKDILQSIWDTYGFGQYDVVNTAVKIANHIDKEELQEHQEMKELIVKISS